MLCCYINLAERKDRRQRLEKSFLENASSNWQLKRIEAIDARLVRERGVKGSLRDAEKACFLSHSFSLGIHRELQSPLLIVEDDAEFGPLSCSAIEAAVARAEIGALGHPICRHHHTTTCDDGSTCRASNKLEGPGNPGTA